MFFNVGHQVCLSNHEVFLKRSTGTVKRSIPFNETVSRLCRLNDRFKRKGGLCFRNESFRFMIYRHAPAPIAIRDGKFNVYISVFRGVGIWVTPRALGFHSDSFGPSRRKLDRLVEGGWRQRCFLLATALSTSKKSRSTNFSSISAQGRANAQPRIDRNKVAQGRKPIACDRRGGFSRAAEPTHVARIGKDIQNYGWIFSEKSQRR